MRQVGALRQEQAAALDGETALIIRPQTGQRAQQSGFTNAAAAFKQQPFGGTGGEREAVQQGAAVCGVEG